MPRLWLRTEAKLIGGPIRAEAEFGPFKFAVTDPVLEQVVEVTISPSGDRVSTALEADASDELLSELRTTIPPRPDGAGPSLDHISDTAEEELRGLTSAAHRCRIRLLRLIEQEFWDPRIEADRVSAAPGASQWSEDKASWHTVPTRLHMVASIESYGRLNPAAVAEIQALLDQGEAALVGTHHLLQAHRSRSRRSAWIDATVAAELAVKETLVRIEPAVEPLLNDLPSPPLSHLYGRVLEAYTGDRSPQRKALIKGSERRNQLVHQPVRSGVELEELRDYLDAVEQAIQHLLGLTRDQSPPRQA